MLFYTIHRKPFRASVLGSLSRHLQLNCRIGLGGLCWNNVKHNRALKTTSIIIIANTGSYYQYYNYYARCFQDPIMLDINLCRHNPPKPIRQLSCKCLEIEPRTLALNGLRWIVKITYLRLICRCVGTASANVKRHYHSMQ